MDSPKWAQEGMVLGQLIDSRYDSRAEFARLLDVSDDVLSNLCRGVTRLRGDRKKKALKLLGDLPATVLLPREDPGEAQRDRGPLDVRNVGRNVRADKSGFIVVPVYGSVPAGNPAGCYSQAIQTIDMAEWGNDFDRWGRVVLGNSMNPEFEDGDIVIFESRSAQSGRDYGHAVYATREGEDTFKVLREGDDGKLELWPANDAYEPFSAEGWHIWGVAIRRIRQGDRFEDERKYPLGFIHRFR
jgi:SOS-response transcriptional repressor LexA